MYISPIFDPSLSLNKPLYCKLPLFLSGRCWVRRENLNQAVARSDSEVGRLTHNRDDLEADIEGLKRLHEEATAARPYLCSPWRAL